MSKIFFSIAVILILALTSCASERYLNVEGDLVKVKRSVNPLATKGEPNNISLLRDGFNDKSLLAYISLESNALSIEVKNQSNKKVLIRWNESALIDPNGQSHKIYFLQSKDAEIIHSVYKGPYDSQEPTVLLPDSSISGEINNKDSYIYGQPQRTSGHWVDSTYVPRSASSGYYLNKGILTRDPKVSLAEDQDRNLGRNIKLLLATEIDGKKVDYTFVFQVTKFIER